MMSLVGWLMYNGLRSLPLARGSFQICILSKCMFGGVCDEIEKVQIVTEPPLLTKKTRDELLSYVDTPFSSDYPSHTQRVETGVKLTTAGAARVVGQKRQVGECLMVEASRKKSPGRVTRKRFNI